MAGESGHHLRVVKSRLGCRLPFERSDAGTGYASSGPVLVSKLSPEEMEKVFALYGPPSARNENNLTQAAVKAMVGRSKTLVEAARRLRINEQRLKQVMIRYCIKMPETWKENEEMKLDNSASNNSSGIQNESGQIQENHQLNQCLQKEPDDAGQDPTRGNYQLVPAKKTRLEIARLKLNLEGYKKLKAQGYTDKAIQKQYDIAPDVMVTLKREWGIEIKTLISSSAQITQDNEKKNESPEARDLPTVEQVIQLRDEHLEDLDDIAYIINNATELGVSDRLLILLANHRDQLQKQINRINTVFESTVIHL